MRSAALPLAAALYDGIKGTGSLQWDTTTYCGRPLFADPQAQVFYPPTILAVAVATFFHPSQLAYVLEWALVLHVFAAGVFTYLLLRRMGHSTAASVCGGLFSNWAASSPPRRSILVPSRRPPGCR